MMGRANLAPELTVYLCGHGHSRSKRLSERPYPDIDGYGYEYDERDACYMYNAKLVLTDENVIFIEQFLKNVLKLSPQRLLFSLTNQPILNNEIFV
jgi:hypothetical protein